MLLFQHLENTFLCVPLLFHLQEIVTQSILTNQIPRAQALLRKRGRPEHHLSALRMEGLRQVFSRLQHRDLQTATTLLVNMVRISHCKSHPTRTRTLSNMNLEMETWRISWASLPWVYFVHMDEEDHSDSCHCGCRMTLTCFCHRVCL